MLAFPALCRFWIRFGEGVIYSLDHSHSCRPRRRELNIYRYCYNTIYKGKRVVWGERLVVRTCGETGWRRLDSSGDSHCWQNLVFHRSGATILPILPTIPRVFVYTVRGKGEPLAKFVDLKIEIKDIFSRCIIISTDNHSVFFKKRKFLSGLPSC